jgi:phosphatidylglycerophosphate synthase
MTTPLDRRPLAARNTRLANAVARFLVRLGASPNGISLAGLVAGLLAGVLLALTSQTDGWPRRVCWLAGALLILIRLLANMFDGMVAIASGRTSRLGELFNEFPDRLSDAATLIGLGYAAGGRPEFGYLAALAAVLVAYVRALGKSAGAPNVFAGPMAKQQRMAVVILTALVCAAIPDDWLETASPATWALVLCLAGSAVTIVHRLVLIAGHLKGPPT